MQTQTTTGKKAKPTKRQVNQGAERHTGISRAASYGGSA
jgi:hypothetical protein